MKKQFLIASVLLTGVACATEYTPSNQLGILPVAANTKSGRTLMAIPYCAYGVSGSETINVTDLVQTGNLSEGDKLHVLAANKESYTTYTLNASKQWTGATQVTVGDSGSSTSSADVSASASRGDAFWIETKASTVYLMGQPGGATKAVSVTGGGENFTWNILASSTDSTPVTINTLGGGNGSCVRLDDGTYYIKLDKGWVKFPNVSTVTTDTIPVGKGFTFGRKGDSGTETL